MPLWTLERGSPLPADMPVRQRSSPLVNRGLGQDFLVLQPSPFVQSNPCTITCDRCAFSFAEARVKGYFRIQKILQEVSAGIRGNIQATWLPEGREWPSPHSLAILECWCSGSFPCPCDCPQSVSPSGEFLTVPGDWGHLCLRRTFTPRQALDMVPRGLSLTPKRVTFIFKPLLAPTKRQNEFISRGYIQPLAQLFKQLLWGHPQKASFSLSLTSSHSWQPAFSTFSDSCSSYFQATEHSQEDICLFIVYLVPLSPPGSSWDGASSRNLSLILKRGAAKVWCLLHVRIEQKTPSLW